jgi:hypothetical protein
MLGVAMAALACIGQATVQARLGEALFADIGMAAFAAVGRAAPPGRMTFSALGLEVSVRRIASQRRLAWAGGRKSPRAKWSAAKIAQKDPQNHYHHDRRSAA